MKVIRTIQPNTNGAKRFLREWGDSLVAVRYRENSEENQIYTTIELIVDKRDKPQANICLKRKNAYIRRRVVAIKVGFEETALRKRVKASGGKWSQQQKCWLTTYDKVVAMGLGDRIIEGAAEKCSDVDMFISEHCF